MLDPSASVIATIGSCRSTTDGSGATWGLLTAVGVASFVEFVEALTIVLAMGMTRSWRSALWGAALAGLALAAFTAAAGYALVSWLPESALQLTVGALLLVFGLQWLRKAVLRSSGLMAVHDEELEFREQADAARRARDESRLGLDWFAFVVSFKGVFLEGAEVVFIVITFGLNADNVPLAAVGALAAGSGRGAGGRDRAPAAVGGAGEHPQVRRRPPARDVRDVLVGRGPRRVPRRGREPRVARRRGRPARAPRRLAPPLARARPCAAAHAGPRPTAPAAQAAVAGEGS